MLQYRYEGRQGQPYGQEEDMEKYIKAFEHYNRLVQKNIVENGMTEEEARYNWWAMKLGIVEVAQYDPDLTMEEFRKILEWGV